MIIYWTAPNFLQPLPIHVPSWFDSAEELWELPLACPSTSLAVAGCILDCWKCLFYAEACCWFTCCAVGKRRRRIDATKAQKKKNTSKQAFIFLALFYDCPTIHQWARADCGSFVYGIRIVWPLRRPCLRVQFRPLPDHISRRTGSSSQKFWMIYSHWKLWQ